MRRNNELAIQVSLFKEEVGRLQEERERREAGFTEEAGTAEAAFADEAEQDGGETHDSQGL